MTSSSFFVVFLSAFLIITVAIVLQAILFFLVLRHGILQGGFMVTVSKEQVKKELTYLLAKFRTLSRLDLKSATHLGPFAHLVTHGFMSKHRTQVVVKNQKGENALVAVGLVKHYTPFEGYLKAVFDNHVLSVELKDHTYHYYLDHKLIARQELIGYFKKNTNYIEDEQGTRVLWHDRPLIHVVNKGVTLFPWKHYSYLHYRMYTDPGKKQPVAELNRMHGIRSRTKGINLDTVSGITFLKPLSVKQKASILAFWLIDLTMMY